MNGGYGVAALLDAGHQLTLLLAKMPCEPQIEIAALTRFDGVIIDTEHGPSGGLDLQRHIRAADAAGVPTLVRVPALDPAATLAALDAGAIGIVVPHIRSAAEARASVAAARYWPNGHRGLALSTRAARYGTRSTREHLTRSALETVVMVQIEDQEAVAHADEILRVNGVDAVLIGATDLALSLGHPGDPGHPDVAAAVVSVRAAARAAAVSDAIVVRSAADAQSWHLGGGKIAIFVATDLIAQAFSRAVRSPPDPIGEAAAPAEPLVLLPGMLATAALWSEVASSLHPDVPVRIGRIDLDDSVEEMAETVLASAPNRFALAAHSLGAVVALEIARRTPRRVSRLALLNVGARAGSDAQRQDWEQLRARVERGEFEKLTTEFARTNLGPRRRDEAMVARVESMAREVGRNAFMRQLSAQLTRPDSRSALHTITCPTLVVSGGSDTISQPALQNELARAIPGARLIRIDGCGHMSPLEAPERVAAVLREWLLVGRGCRHDPSLAPTEDAAC